MATYQTTLSIDFGSVGNWRDKQPFQITLDASSLSELIGQARNAHRVYELMLVERPGDIWNYVWVEFDALPERTAQQVERAREMAMPKYGATHPWPEQRMPFVEFDRLFRWAWDDTDPEDEAWLNHRDHPVMRTFAKQLFVMARAAVERLDWNDHLLRHIKSHVRSGKHAYSYLQRQVAIKKGRENVPAAPAYGDDYYSKLEELLRDPELTSVAYRAEGDYRILRMMATEQRRRANRTGHSAGNALYLAALADGQISNEDWDSEIWFFSEGLAHGDLFIEGEGIAGNSIKELVEKYHRVPGRYILSTKDEGDIEGFDRELGNGWVLYRNRLPDGRRRGLERVGSRRQHSPGPLLTFGGQGSTLFSFEKTVFVLGEDVSTVVREALATVIMEWQSHGGDPVLIVMGDAAPFEMSGCRDLLRPVDAADRTASSRWLKAVLRQERPWIDVFIGLDVPVWAGEVLAECVEYSREPWKAWVITNHAEDGLKADLNLDGDLAQRIAEAHRNAVAIRPRML